jgi:hypothetical protein
MKTAPKLALAAVVTVVAALSLLAADQPTSKDVQRREMKKLDWLVGHWKGAGWIQMGPQGRHEFTQTETIDAKLDGLVLVIEGTGKARRMVRRFTRLWRSFRMTIAPTNFVGMRSPPKDRSILKPEWAPIRWNGHWRFHSVAGCATPSRETKRAIGLKSAR